MSKVISLRLDDKIYNMLVCCRAEEKAIADEQQEKYGLTINPYQGLTDSQYAQKILSNVIAKRYVELCQNGTVEVIE